MWQPKAAVTVSAESMAKVSAEIVAISVSVAVGGGIAAGASVATNTISETISASIDDATVTALGGNITVTADSTPTVDTTTVAVAAGTGMSAAASLSNASITSTTQAFVDTSVLTALGNDVIVDATSVTTLDPENLGAAVGITGGIAGILSQATIAGATRAFADGATIVKANSLDLSADDTNTATPRSLVVGAGVLSVGAAGAVSTTNITRTTEAFIGEDAGIDTGAGLVTLTAESTSIATGETTGVGVSTSIGLALLKVDVKVNNTTRAYVGDGATINAGELTLTADADNTVTAPTIAVGVGLLGA